MVVALTRASHVAGFLGDELFGFALLSDALLVPLAAVTLLSGGRSS